MKIIVHKRFNHIKLLWLSIFALLLVLNFNSGGWSTLLAMIGAAGWWSIYTLCDWFKYSVEIKYSIESKDES